MLRRWVNFGVAIKSEEKRTKKKYGLGVLKGKFVDRYGKFSILKCLSIKSPLFRQVRDEIQALGLAD